MPRPKRILDVRDYRLITQLVRAGAAHKHIAHALRVSAPTWRAIRLRDPLANAAVRRGRSGPQGPSWMPEFGKLLTEEERWQVVTYLRSLQGQ